MILHGNLGICFPEAGRQYCDASALSLVNMHRRMCSQHCTTWFECGMIMTGPRIHDDRDESSTQELMQPPAARNVMVMRRMQ